VLAALVACGFMTVAREGLAGGPRVRTAAGVLLVATGMRTLVPHVSRARLARDARNGFVTSFVLAVSNPMLRVSIGTIFAAVAPGSTLWRLALTAVVAAARRRCPEGLVRKAERGCGVLVVLPGVIATTSAWFH
jgi:hypothetical protein